MLKQFFNIWVIIMTLGIHANNGIINYDDIYLQVPLKPLKTHALEITTRIPKDYTSWSAVESKAAFEFFKEISLLWKEKKIGEQYFVYGKQNLEGNQPFSWQILPYNKTNNFISRIWQQIVVIWRIVFGGFVATKDYIQQQVEKYKDDFENWKSDEIVPEMNHEPGKDPFCDAEKIAKQSVFEGRNIRILYNYAPIGFDGEPLHFLILPKRHVSNYNQLTNEEDSEIADLSKKLITYFKTNRKSQEAYLFWKNGVDAGQSVDHFHLHLILTGNKVQTIWDKLTVLRIILFGSSPLPPDQLKTKVESLKVELIKNF